jgi:hypothetical protein
MKKIGIPVIAGILAIGAFAFTDKTIVICPSPTTNLIWYEVAGTFNCADLYSVQPTSLVLADHSVLGGGMVADVNAQGYYRSQNEVVNSGIYPSCIYVADVICAVAYAPSTHNFEQVPDGSGGFYWRPKLNSGGVTSIKPICTVCKPQ